MIADGSNFFGKCGVSNSLFGTNPVILLGGFKEVELNLEQPPTICHIFAYLCIPWHIAEYGILCIARSRGLLNSDPPESLAHQFSALGVSKMLSFKVHTQVFFRHESGVLEN